MITPDVIVAGLMLIVNVLVLWNSFDSRRSSSAAKQASLEAALAIQTWKTDAMQTRISDREHLDNLLDKGYCTKEAHNGLVVRVISLEQRQWPQRQTKGT